MSTPSYIGSINEFLLNKYGFDYMRRPIFRVVWSSSQTEKVGGEWEVFYGPIYLRTERGVRERLKYPFIKDRWIVERLFPNNPEATEIQSDHTYEAFYVFQDKDHDYLPPILEMADLACWIDLQVRGAKRAPRNWTKEETKHYEKMTKKYEDYLNHQDMDWTATKIHHGEAILNPVERPKGVRT